MQIHTVKQPSFHSLGDVKVNELLKLMAEDVVETWLL